MFNHIAAPQCYNELVMVYDKVLYISRVYEDNIID